MPAVSSERGVGVEKLEHGSHRLECRQGARPEHDLDVREAAGTKAP